MLIAHFASAFRGFRPQTPYPAPYHVTPSVKNPGYAYARHYWYVPSLFF